MVVIIPCGGRKLSGTHPARELYCGPYFRACLTTAKRLTTADRIFILSGKYGFVRPDRALESYEQRIDRPGAVSIERLVDQAILFGFLNEPVTVLAGRVYVDRVKRAVTGPVTTPLVGIGGIGLQMRRLAAIRAAA